MYRFSRSLHKDPKLSCILQSRVSAPNPNLVKELESYAPYFEDWFDKIHKEIWDDIEKRLGKKAVQNYRSGSPFVELLRFVRNTWAHITDFNVSEEILKCDPDSFYSYIDAQFPVFLMIAYRVAYKFYRKQPWFRYFLRCDYNCSRILKKKPEFLCTYGSERLTSLLMTAYRPRGDGKQTLCSRNGEIVLEL